MLDVKSIDKGMLIPRLTTAQRTAISTPAAGLLVFDTSEGNFYFHNGSSWISLSSETNGIWDKAGSNVFLSTGTDKVGVGTNSMATGYESKAIGDYSQAFGYKSKARGNYSTAIGNNAVAGIEGSTINAFASGGSSVAIGALDTASAEFSTVFGFKNMVSGYCGVTGGGENNYVSGKQATISGGNGNIASGDGATVSGGIANSATANNASVSGGIFNEATGYASAVGGGQGCDATGSRATSLGGYYAVASGNNSVASGQWLEAHDFCEIVFGSYNEISGGNQGSWVSGDNLFVVANGSGFGDRKNALTILKNGRTGIGRSPTTNKLEVNGTASKTVLGDWPANSDRRIKTDICEIKDPFETMLKLHPITFRYTDEWRDIHPEIKDKVYYNFIAQEYQQVFPESVQGSGEYLMDDEEEILQIDTYNARIVTIKAVQLLINENKLLKEEIRIMKSEIENIKTIIQASGKTKGRL